MLPLPHSHLELMCLVEGVCFLFLLYFVVQLFFEVSAGRYEHLLFFCGFRSLFLQGPCVHLIPQTMAKPDTSALLVHKSPVHGLIACGGEDGFLECFDLRQKASVGRILAVGAGNEDQVRDNLTPYSAWHDLFQRHEVCSLVMK